VRKTGPYAAVRKTVIPPRKAQGVGATIQLPQRGTPGKILAGPKRGRR